MLPSLILSKPSVKPFGFLQHLEGCQKGMTKKGVHQLKLYLKFFGYLHYDDDHINHLNGDDVFDDHLESAIKTYQLNYGLKVTGSLDSQTVKEMMKPRCGVADIIDGRTRMPSGNKKNQYGLLFNFFDGNLKWPASQTHLTYRFRSMIEVVDLQALRSVMSRAFTKWAAVTHFTFAEAAPETIANIEIGFYRLEHGDGASFDGPGGVVAHSAAPTGGISHYDADEKWSTGNPNETEMDLESVALHEIGHLLGLQHSADPGAVMVSGIGPGVIKRELQPDDIQGIRTLYNLSG
ncbi:Matrix metalloproteinase-16 [Thalictrum thalictroides]|uniref:Matrix metalloproteinase-16 n=1 Tax=Thalictrum thalictroides TaxID=46969 RepID=A0A7J6WFB1_THATH|nr:Matrix metalloproteinase-16 [Thalictrum thalictroides]